MLALASFLAFKQSILNRAANLCPSPLCLPISLRVKIDFFLIHPARLYMILTHLLPNLLSHLAPLAHSSCIIHLLFLEHSGMLLFRILNGCSLCSSFRDLCALILSSTASLGSSLSQYDHTDYRSGCHHKSWHPHFSLSGSPLSYFHGKFYLLTY